MTDTNQATEKQKIWNYSFPADGVKITLGALAGGALLIGGLSQIFNPVALGLAVGYGAAKTAFALTMTGIPSLTNYSFNKMIKKGSLAPVPDDEEIVKIAADISKELDRDEPPKVYFANKALVAKMALPFGLRWMLKLMLKNDKVADSVMSRVFAAVPGTNKLITTHEGLEKLSDKAELRFIVAHEMSHLKRDYLSPAIMTRSFIKSTSRALFWGSVAALGAGLVGFSLPVSAILGGSALAAIGGLTVVKTAAEMVSNYALRTMESRADRNAIYITRDIKGAVEALETLHDKELSKAEPVSVIKEALLTHPSQIKRTKALCTAFEKASKYPKLGGANDNAVPVAEKTEKKKIAF